MKSKKTNIWKTLISIPLCLLMSIFDLISEKDNYNIVDLFAHKVFGRMSFDNESTFILTMQNLIFVVVCNILFSEILAKHFRTGSVYVFSRIHSRSKWYTCKVIELLFYTTMFSTLYLLSTILICCYRSTATIQANQVIMLLLIFLFAGLFCGSTTLLVNLLTIKFGTTVSFLVVQLTVLTFIFLAMSTSHIPIAILLNPVSCLNILDTTYNTSGILITNTVFLCIIFLAGLRYINNYDIYLFDAEAS